MTYLETILTVLTLLYIKLVL